MNVNDMLKQLIKDSGRTRSGVAAALGFPNVQTLDRRLLSESVPKVDFAAALLRELGYELVVVRRDDLPRLKGRGTVIDGGFQFGGRSGGEGSR